MILICFYVDDIIYMGSSQSSQSSLDDFKAGMKSTFEMSDLGVLHYFLGLEVTQSNDGIFINQKKYAEELLQRFQMTQCNKTHSPMNTNEKMQIQDCWVQPICWIG